jgi:hypothetical protein
MSTKKPTERQFNHLADVATRLTLERNALRVEHADVECSECGSTFCKTAMQEVAVGIGGHSQDIKYDEVCPYCFMRFATHESDIMVDKPFARKHCGYCGADAPLSAIRWHEATCDGPLVSNKMRLIQDPEADRLSVTTTSCVNFLGDTPEHE